VIFVIAAYKCEVAGKLTDSVDYQVRYFTGDSIKDVFERLQNEKPNCYSNCYGDEVRWAFEDTVALEIDPRLEDGEEIIGFITGRTKRNRRGEDSPGA
jgi:hypothetical protein